MAFESKSFYIDSILNHRETADGGYQFLIKWKNSFLPTWQPFANLKFAEDIISKYLGKYQLKENSWFKNGVSRSSNILNHSFQNEFLLKYDDFFPQKPISLSQRFRCKTTKNANILHKQYQKKQIIEWNNIKKVVKISRNLQTNYKWMILVQWFDSNKQPLWIQRDIMRFANPFALYEFYCTMQYKQKKKTYFKIPKPSKYQGKCKLEHWQNQVLSFKQRLLYETNNDEIETEEQPSVIEID